MGVLFILCAVCAQGSNPSCLSPPPPTIAIRIAASQIQLPKFSTCGTTTFIIDCLSHNGTNRHSIVNNDGCLVACTSSSSSRWLWLRTGTLVNR